MKHCQQTKHAFICYSLYNIHVFTAFLNPWAKLSEHENFTFRLLKESDFGNETNLRTLYPSIFSYLSKIQRKVMSVSVFHCEWILNLLATLIVETAARSSTEHDVYSMTTPAGLNISAVCPTKLSNPSPAHFPFPYRSNYITTMF